MVCKLKSAIYFVIIFFMLLNQSILSNFNNDDKICGRVIDAKTKEPLVGANVIIKKTNIGTATDNKGYFEIKKVSIPNPELIISMIGYQTVVYPLETNNQENLIIELTETLIEMGAVVVTGTNTLHLYEESPVKTEIVPKKLMQLQNACNLAQALNLQTGVMVENDCNNCNFTQVRILGFDGKYSQILIDGDPVIGSLGSVYGLEHYPQEMIEQIEIVKGGGSALYGGGAIAGTINMITRRPAFNRTKIQYTLNNINRTLDQYIGAIAEIISENNKTGFYIYGSTRNRNSYDRNKDGLSELGKLNNLTIGFNGYLKPFENTELTLSFHRILEERRGGSDFDKPVHEASIAEWTRHLKWGGKFKWTHKVSSHFEYKINYAFSLLNRDSYYGGLSENSPEARLKALNYYGNSNNPIHIFGLQANTILSNQTITLGIQLEQDELTDKSVSNNSFYINDIYKNIGFFIQDEISLDEKNHSQLVAGLRFDKHSSINNWIFSPRINFKTELFESLKIRSGFTTGFKAPQIFDEDLHICGLEGTQRVIRNSQGLKEEKSFTYYLGFEFQDFLFNTPFLLGLNFFYSRLKGAYGEKFISSEGNIEHWERINSKGANVKGIEIDFGIKPVKKLEIRSGFTIKSNLYDDYLEDYQIRQFLRTPNSFGYVRILYDYSENLNLFITTKYTGSMYIPHEISSEHKNEPIITVKKSNQFVELDIALLYKLKILEQTDLNISLGIKNITDTYQKDLDWGIKRDPGYVYGPSLPRTFYINLGFGI
ncbi:MAG: TonB-dependent receptor [Melioribacter sp.]|nr:TonB-dependent receptor [Melioribacter sp.]